MKNKKVQGGEKMIYDLFMIYDFPGTKRALISYLKVCGDFAKCFMCMFHLILTFRDR